MQLICTDCGLAGTSTGAGSPAKGGAELGFISRLNFETGNGSGVTKETGIPTVIGGKLRGSQPEKFLVKIST
jgi:hypothetical protein